MPSQRRCHRVSLQYYYWDWVLCCLVFSPPRKCCRCLPSNSIIVPTIITRETHLNCTYDTTLTTCRNIVKSDYICLISVKGLKVLPSFAIPVYLYFELLVFKRTPQTQQKSSSALSGLVQNVCFAASTADSALALKETTLP